MKNSKMNEDLDRKIENLSPYFFVLFLIFVVLIPFFVFRTEESEESIEISEAGEKPRRLLPQTPEDLVSGKTSFSKEEF